MWHFNSVLTSLFDLLLAPFQSLHPFWSLLILSLPTTILILVIIRYTSNQEGIRETKNKIRAHLLEIRIYKDNFGVLLSAEKKILTNTFKYLKYLLKPMFLVILPVAIIIIQLEGWFGNRPLKTGESTIISLKLSDDNADFLKDINIEADKGLVVETPPLRMPNEKEINWRIRAYESGEHNLIFDISGDKFRKSVIVSNGELRRVSPIVASSLWDTFLNPGEEPIAENFLVKRIEVDYPPRSIEIFGWEFHWLLVFFILTMIFGFALKGLLRVDF